MLEQGLLHPLPAHTPDQEQACRVSQCLAHVSQVPDKGLQLLNMAVLNVTGAEVEILLGTGGDGTIPHPHATLQYMVLRGFVGERDRLRRTA